ncbi:MAG: FGGY family carbohydrate kinase [Anaerolineales bacterium]|nr:FGGY family carbohydrate kinase [Anaerolineales bacterium]
MSLLGIDIGTTGCKTAIFSHQGEILASSYTEYDANSAQPGWAELDSLYIWGMIKDSIRYVVSRVLEDPVEAISISSLGEAVVPISSDGRILGPSILNFDLRGEEYLPDLQEKLKDEHLYQISGNSLGNHYSLTKLMWIKEHQPDLYDQTHKFLHWSGFVSFMLGADPVIDYSLANRTLLFDINQVNWSEEILSLTGLDREKLPTTVPSGTVTGKISHQIAAELGLRPNTLLVSGAHDQCSNAVGCGVIDAGGAVFGMGTYICITPVFIERRSPDIMVERGINTEHHAVPGKYVSFLYNQGGSIVKWFRDTYAAAEHRQAMADGDDIYPTLFSEIPTEPGNIIVLPHFTTTGPPDFISDSCGVMVGMRLDTSRGEILKGIIEGTTYYLREGIDSLPSTGIEITHYRAAGGGSQSDMWVQTCADIMGTPITRPEITEAGALGAAIIAGVGSGIFASHEEGVQAMVKMEHTFEPDPKKYEQYNHRYEQYRRLWPLLKEYLFDFTAEKL